MVCVVVKEVQRPQPYRRLILPHLHLVKRWLVLVYIYILIAGIEFCILFQFTVMMTVNVETTLII